MNEPINDDDKECVYKFWQHDKEDVDQDADLIEFLGGKTSKKKKKSKSSRTKTQVEQPQQQNISIHAQNEEPRHEPSPKRFTKMMNELNINSQGRDVSSPLKVKQKSQALIEDPLNSPLIQLNPSASESTAVQTLKKQHAPSNSLSSQLGYYKLRPSFNAGAPFNDPQQQPSLAGSIEGNNNTVKLSEFIGRKSTKNPSGLPYLPNHGEHQNAQNALLIPLKQYAEETLDDYDGETTKYSTNIHPTLSKVKTPHQQSSMIVPTTWGEVNLGGRTSPMKDFQERIGRTLESPTQMLGTDSSPNFARRPQNRQSQSVIQPIPLQQGAQILHVPLYNLQPTTNLNEGPLRRSLVRLPTINTTSKGGSMDMSPGKASPLIFDKTPGRQSIHNIRDQSQNRDQSGSPFVVERKLSRFLSNSHLRNDLSVFKAAAARQLQEFAN